VTDGPVDARLQDDRGLSLGQRPDDLLRLPAVRRALPKPEPVLRPGFGFSNRSPCLERSLRPFESRATRAPRELCDLAHRAAVRIVRWSRLRDVSGLELVADFQRESTCVCGDSGNARTGCLARGPTNLSGQ
jgi:hypothetical protein